VYVTYRSCLRYPTYRYDAFHFAHIILLFIGFVFLIQSGILTSLVSTRRKTLLAHENCTSEQLIVDYVKLHTKGGMRKKLFEHGPISIPIPPLREKIEYKIIQEFFVRNYNLPPEFRFTNYMCGVLRDYVLSLVEVRPISWVVMACFATLNLARVRLIDPVVAYEVCDHYPAKGLHRGAHRLLSAVYSGLGADPGAEADDPTSHVDAEDVAYSHHVCEEYLLRYTLMCVFFLFLYLIGVLIASEVYIQRLVDKVLDQEETIEWLEDEEQKQFMAALETEYGEVPPGADSKANTAPTSAAGGTPNAASMDGASAATAAAAAADVAAGAMHGERGEPILEMSPRNKTANAKPPLPTSSPRRLSKDHRPGGLKTRSVSVEDLLRVAQDLPSPPPPVHGTAAVRRLSVNHRVGSGAAELIAAGAAKEPAPAPLNPATAHLPPTHPHRRGMTLANYRMQSLRTEAELTKQHSAHAAGLHGAAHDPTKADESKVPADPKVAAFHNARRLAAAHRAGSLRSDLGNADLLDHSSHHGGPGGATTPAPHQAPGPGVRRLASAQRMGSLRSAQSEQSEKHSGGASGGGGNRFSLVNSSQNRRFLYLRCLERIMHQEFDFHANEARRMRHENVPHPDDNSSYDTSRPGTAVQSTQPSTPRHLASPEGHARPSPGHVVRRTHSTASMNEVEASDPLVHGDMRSNFLLMQSLRKEMLQETQAQQESEHRQKSLFSIGAHRKSFFVTSSQHGTPEPPMSGSKEKELALRPIAGRQQSGLTPSHGDRGSQQSLVSALTEPSHAVQDAYESSPDPNVHDHRDRTVASMEEGHGHHHLHSPSADSDIPEHSHSHGRPHERRQRTFSLAFESPPLTKAQSPKTKKGIYRLDSITSTVSVATAKFTGRAWSALTGHHIGLKESRLDADIADLQKDFSKIFAFRSAELYYFMVEFALLLQCVYLALWATNFVFIATDSYFPVLWHIALVVPIPLNFLITKQIIFTSVMLKSIVTLDKFVADKICEDAVDERNVRQRVRKVLRAALRAMEIPKENWEQYTQDQFELFIPDSDVGLNLANFKLFLHSMQIFLTDVTVDKIFKVLDVTLEDEVQWENVFPVVFPELVRKQVKLNRAKSAGEDMSIDLQIQGNLKSARAKKAETKQKRAARRQSAIVGSTLATIGEENRAAEGAERRARFADTSNSETETSASNGARPKRKTHRSPPVGIAASRSVAEDEHLVDSDASDRGDVSSASSFNSHSLSDGASSEDERQHMRSSQYRANQSPAYHSLASPAAAALTARGSDANRGSPMVDVSELYDDTTEQSFRHDNSHRGTSSMFDV
jgi:hypothetical protein